MLYFIQTTSVQLTLQYSAAKAADDYSYHWWDYMKLNNVATSSVTVTALSHYSKRCNGLMEVEFYTGISK